MKSIQCPKAMFRCQISQITGTSKKANKNQNNNNKCTETSKGMAIHIYIYPWECERVCFGVCTCVCSKSGGSFVDFGPEGKYV